MEKEGEADVLQSSALCRVVGGRVFHTSGDGICVGAEQRNRLAITTHGRRRRRRSSSSSSPITGRNAVGDYGSGLTHLAERRVMRWRFV